MNYFLVPKLILTSHKVTCKHFGLSLYHQIKTHKTFVLHSTQVMLLNLLQMNIYSMYNSVNVIFNVAKYMYHLGKVKLERVGQRSFPTVCEPTGRFSGNCRALCVPFCQCCFALQLCLLIVEDQFCLLANHCGFLLIVADQFLPSCKSLWILADRSGSIFVFLRIIADSCSLSSLPAWWFCKYFLR